MERPRKPYHELSQKQKKRRIDQAVLRDVARIPIVNEKNNKPAEHLVPDPFSISDQTAIPPGHLIDTDIIRDSDKERQPAMPNTPLNLQTFLARWGCEHKVAHSAVDELLVGSREAGHDDLPSDARTLFGTPATVSMQPMTPGGCQMIYLQNQEVVQMIDANFHPVLQPATQLQGFLPAGVNLADDASGIVGNENNGGETSPENGNNEDEDFVEEGDVDNGEDGGGDGQEMPPEPVVLAQASEGQGQRQGGPHNHAVCCPARRKERRQEHELVLLLLDELLAQIGGRPRQQVEIYHC